jgi:phosphatidyl-myo-inositol dimannoside synthase
MKILAISYDYKPRLGGIATLTYEILESLRQIPSIDLKLLAAAESGRENETSVFDRQSSIQTKRIPLAQPWYKAVGPLSLEIRKELDENSPDLVLCFLWAPEGVATWLALKTLIGRKIPYYLFVYGVEVLETNTSFQKTVRSIFSPLKKQIFRESAGVLSISHFTRDLVTQNCGIESDKVHMVIPGVNTDMFYPEKANRDLVNQYNLQGKTVFTTVTRLVDYKGIDHCLFALKEVVRSHPNTAYMICGVGEDQTRLESIVRDLDLKNHVIFTGPIPPEQLRSIYNLSDVFMLVSRNDWKTPNVEGFGLVVLEAAACGVPSIVGNSGGMSDTLVPGQTGWIVDPENIESIADAMTDAVKDPEKTKQMGESARDRAVSKCTWDHMASALLHSIKRKMAA